jgi:hypothetical protein
VAAENRLLREALASILTKRGNIDVVGLSAAAAADESNANAIQQLAEAFWGQALVEWEADDLLLISRGKLEEDLRAIKQAHSEAPDVPSCWSERPKRAANS